MPPGPLPFRAPAAPPHPAASSSQQPRDGRLVTSLLFGVRPGDPLQLADAVLILAATTAVAAYVPARRAARLDPMAALQEE
jgi:hypothetical protein